jgi:hypothetical protein
MSFDLPLVKATTEGVVRAPSEFSKTLGDPPSKILNQSVQVLAPVTEEAHETQELVVPRSILHYVSHHCQGEKFNVRTR